MKKKFILGLGTPKENASFLGFHYLRLETLKFGADEVVPLRSRECATNLKRKRPPTTIDGFAEKQRRVKHHSARERAKRERDLDSRDGRNEEEG